MLFARTVAKNYLELKKIVVTIIYSYGAKRAEKRLMLEKSLEPKLNNSFDSFYFRKRVVT